jgi:hypothetical protein
MNVARRWWIVVLLVLNAPALAQAPAYLETGTLLASVDGEAVTLHTHVTVVPDDAENVEDARARALAGSLAGREVATATAIVTPPLVVGGVVAMPATLTLELRGSVGAPERGRDDLRELVIGIRVDPDTLAWSGDPDHVSVAYHPERWSGTSYYQLHALERLELHTVEQTAERTLRVAGRLEATLVWRSGAFVVAFDLDRQVDLVVDFDIDPVIGDEALTALLMR